MRRDLALLCVPAFLLAASGGPPWFHPDSIVPRALAAVRHGGDSGFFDYPALVTDLDAGVYALLFAAERLAGRVRTFDTFEARAVAGAGRAPSFELPAQLVSALFSVLGVACAYGLARRVTARRGPALLAGAFTGASLLWVANAHYPTVDMPLAALCAASVLLALHALARPWTPGTAIRLGTLVGLTTATKYNGALVAASVVAPLWAQGRGSPGRLLARLALMLGVAVLAFLLVDPYAIPHFHRFTVNLRMEAGWLRHGVGHLGYQTEGPALWHYLGAPLRDGYGLLPLAFAIVGLARLVAGRTPSLAEKLALTAFPVAFFALMGSSRLAFHRYLLPLIPLAAVYSALGVEAIETGLAALARRCRAPAFAARLTTGVLVLWALLPNLGDAIRHDRLLSRPDTRGVLARALARAGGDRPLRVFATGYTRQILLDARVLPGARFTETLPARDARDSIDLVVLDSFEHDRYLYDPRGAGLWTAPRGYEDLVVLQLSPFSRPKEEVPFSPSNASPFPPDLRFRDRPGPFVEICARDTALAGAIAAACAREGRPCRRVSGRESYYLSRLGRARG